MFETYSRLAERALRRLADKRHQSRRARIDRLVETVPEPGNDHSVGFTPSRDALRNRRRQIGTAFNAIFNIEIEFGALLTRAAVNITEHVHPGGHDIV